MAERLLTRGYRVHGCSRGKNDLNHTSYCHDIINLDSEPEIGSWVDAVYRKRSRIDLCLINAATSSSRLALLTNSAQIHSLFQINFFSAVFLIRTVSKIMIQQRFGRIIVLSSIRVLMNDVGTSEYVSSKMALEAYVKVMGRELAGFGVTCNVIRIPIVESDLSRSLPQDVVQRVLDRVPSKRFATVDDIYPAVEWLARPEGSYINGTVLSLGFDT